MNIEICGMWNFLAFLPFSHFKSLEHSFCDAFFCFLGVQLLGQCYCSCGAVRMIGFMFLFLLATGTFIGRKKDWLWKRDKGYKIISPIGFLNSKKAGKNDYCNCMFSQRSVKTLSSWLEIVSFKSRIFLLLLKWRWPFSFRSTEEKLHILLD